MSSIRFVIVLFFTCTSATSFVFSSLSSMCWVNSVHSALFLFVTKICFCVNGDFYSFVVGVESVPGRVAVDLLVAVEMYGEIGLCCRFVDTRVGVL